MSLSKKIVLFHVSFFVFCSFFQPCFSTEDILVIEIYDLEPSLEILQGKCKSHPFEIYNAYNESILIYYIIDNPSDMDITSVPDENTLLESGATTDGILYICVDEHFSEDTYNINFWIGTWIEINNTGSYRKSDFKSDRQTIEVMILNNPEITTTTTAITETTTSTIRSYIISTIPTYTPTSTTTVRSFDIDIDKPKIENLPGKEKLVTVAVIVIALILIMIPYITFIKGRKAKTGES